MAIEITIFEEKAIAKGPFPLPFIRVLSSLSGRKVWTGSKQVSFQPTGSNLRLLKESDFEIVLIDKSGVMQAIDELQSMATQHTNAKLELGKYKPKMPLLKHMKKALSISKGRKVYAYLLEMGLCKTAITLHDAGMLFLEGKVTGVLIMAPKGVHRQWIEEQLPEQLDEKIPVSAQVWRGSETKINWEKLCTKGSMNFLAMNVDSVSRTIGYDVAKIFLESHKGKSMMVLDESHLIKSPGADRTKAITSLGKLAEYRRILTGTPISKNLMDAWTQFRFLDERILGHKYAVSFKSRFCIMGGFENREIVGQKNTEEFYSLIAPHALRLTKKEVLDLPEKQYVTREYAMGEETKRHYENLRATFMTALEDGTIVDVKNAAVAMLRLQQVLCGYLPFKEEKDGTVKNKIEVISHERIDVLLEICRQINGPTVIWSRFHEDVRRIKLALEKEFGKNSVVNYTGLESDKEKAANKQAFIKGKAQFFNSIAAAGGTGTDGLQKAGCENEIFHSNSFNALHRWQGEDRLHRVGMGKSLTIFDIRATRSVDGSIISNLKAKKSIADLTFDQIRQAIAGG